jgi:hypothetical protein
MYGVFVGIFLLVCSCVQVQATDRNETDIEMVYRKVQEIHKQECTFEGCQLFIDGKVKPYVYYPIIPNSPDTSFGIYIPFQLEAQFTQLYEESNGKYVDLSVLGNWVINTSVFSSGNDALFAPRLISNNNPELIVYFGIRKKS